jgi:hypothetical protein
VEVEQGARLEYTGRAAIVVRGLSTGQVYSFSASDRVQRVDSRDADALRRTHLFG